MNCRYNKRLGPPGHFTFSTNTKICPKNDMPLKQSKHHFSLYRWHEILPLRKWQEPINCLLLRKIQWACESTAIPYAADVYIHIYIRLPPYLLFPIAPCCQAFMSGDWYPEAGGVCWSRELCGGGIGIGTMELPGLRDGAKLASFWGIIPANWYKLICEYATTLLTPQKNKPRRNCHNIFRNIFIEE